MRCHVMCCHVSCHVMPCHVGCCDVMWCYVRSWGDVMWCEVMWFDAVVRCNELEDDVLWTTESTCHSTTTPYYTVLLRTTKFLRTTKYCSLLQSTEKYSKILLHTTKQYSVLESTTRYYKGRLRTTQSYDKVLPRTTKESLPPEHHVNFTKYWPWQHAQSKSPHNSLIYVTLPLRTAHSFQLSL